MFQDALDLVLKTEGGYSNDPNDPGGATNYGITQSVYDPSGNRNIKDITQTEVDKIYYEDYWLTGKCDKIEEISVPLASIHFDCCVNCGVVTAARLLQSVLGVTTDGIIGTVTLSHIVNVPSQAIEYIARRKLYYDRLIEEKPNLAEFRNTWYHRLNKLALEYNLNMKI